jgi:hypothetical protein
MRRSNPHREDAAADAELAREIAGIKSRDFQIVETRRIPDAPTRLPDITVPTTARRRSFRPTTP